VFDGYLIGAYGGLETARKFLMPVKTGDRVWASTKLHTNGCRGVVAIFMVNETGMVNFAEFVGDFTGPSPTGMPFTDPDSYIRTGGFATVQEGSVYAGFFVRYFALGVGNVYGLQIEGQITKVSPGQELPPRYIPGPVDPVADRTVENIAAGFVGQGNQATANTSSGLLANRPVGNNGDTYHATDTVETYFKSGGVWVKVGDIGGGPAAGLTVTLNQTLISGVGFGGNVTTNAVTATVSGGSGSYSYAWSIASKDNENSNPVVTNPTGQSTAARANVASGDVSGSIQLLVLDTANGLTATRAVIYDITSTA
jgi:hypothetical protein